MAWTQIVDDFGELVYRAAYKILSHPSDAEDVTQDVLLEAYCRHQKTGRLPEAGLLRRMATLRAIDQLRRRKPTISLDDSEAPSDQMPATAVVEETRAEQLRRLISRLPNRQVECFLLRYVEGLSNEEISVALGVSSSAVSTALHKARSSLRAAIACDPTAEKTQ